MTEIRIPSPRSVIAIVLAAALLLVMMLSLNVPPVFSGDKTTCGSYDDYGQCVIWIDEGDFPKVTPTPAPTSTPDGSEDED